MTARGITPDSKNYDGSMRVTSKGQVTIPQGIRERHGLMPDTEIEFVERDGEVVVRAAAVAARDDRGTRLIERLRTSGHGRMSTDEIMRLTRDWAD
jgi:AbrB family looped-hinge helix DNA binding protein